MAASRQDLPFHFTPATLAERWGVSKTCISEMLRSGKIRHFVVGKRRYRIPLHVVEEYEACQSEGTSQKSSHQTHGQGSTEADGAPSGETKEGISVAEFYRRKSLHERRHRSTSRASSARQPAR